MAASAAQPTYRMRGVQDLLEVFEDRVAITPQGFLGFLNKGLKGTKTIPYASITAIQFRKAGPIVSGYLQFTLGGGLESRGGVLAATKDENTFMFGKTSVFHKNDKPNNEIALAIKNHIEAKVMERPPPTAASPARFCRSCGTPRSEGAMFCATCGERM